MVIKTIVICGGGPSIMKPLGAIQYLEQQNFWFIENIQSIYATSAGTWLATLILLKIDWETINNYIVNRPWKEVFSINALELFNMYTSKGIYNEKIIEIFFSPFFKSKDVSLEITLKEFYDITKVDFHLYTFELNTFKIIDLSYDTHPNLKLFTAIYMSSCIPIIFSPICCKDNNSCFIDGGMVSNYPLNFCLQSGKNEEEILSFKNIYEDETPKLVTSDTNTLEYLMIFLNNIIKNLDTENKQKEIKYEVKCITKHITIDYLNEFLSSKDLRKRLLDEGITIGKKFYE
jgi:predicted acylesterase/phospholipase RssA